jgi:hypothetical protein
VHVACEDLHVDILFILFNVLNMLKMHLKIKRIYAPKSEDTTPLLMTFK